jgi:hypothetical protein
VPAPCYAAEDFVRLIACHSIQVSGLAMLSLLAVFKDIAPGYRIRPPTAKELEVKVGQQHTLPARNKGQDQTRIAKQEAED